MSRLFSIDPVGILKACTMNVRTKSARITATQIDSKYSRIVVFWYGGAADSASGPGGKRYQIAVIPKGTTHVFWKSVHAGALQAAERLRLAVCETPILLPQDAVTVTASLGLACADNPQESLQSLLRRADQALYQAKDSGRNQVVVAAAPAPCSRRAATSSGKLGAAAPSPPAVIR
mgnify:CR=1 FL=1